MINAKKELLDHVKDRDVELVRIVFCCPYSSSPRKIVEGALDEVLPQLDFLYDDGFGTQGLFGYIWYKNGAWSERGEYDGSEWWEHKERPPLDVFLKGDC
jgi:hypothetical protein